MLDLLAEYVDVHAPDAYRDELEDHFSVTKISPGKLWLEPLTTGGKVNGPVSVPVEVTQICREAWDSEELVKRSGLPSESLIEVGNEHRLADDESLAAMVKAVQREREW